MGGGFAGLGGAEPPYQTVPTPYGWIGTNISTHARKVQPHSCRAGGRGSGTGNRNGQRPAPILGAGVIEPALPKGERGGQEDLILPDVGAIDDSREIAI